jgi:hypothetical protein
MTRKIAQLCTRLARLDRDSCRWIDGDPRAQHTYCSAETKQGSNYCAEHHARAYCSRPLKPIAIPKNAFGARG